MKIEVARKKIGLMGNGRLCLEKNLRPERLKKQKFEGGIDIVVIEKSDFLGIHEFNPTDVKVGDVVVYDAAWYDQPVIHRVINITQINGSTYYVIKGDNNDSPDPYYVSPNQINERVVTFGDNLCVIPYVGYLSLWLRGL